MILIDILTEYQNILNAFTQAPLNDATQVFGICAGILIAIQVIRKISR